MVASVVTDIPAADVGSAPKIINFKMLQHISRLHSHASRRFSNYLANFVPQRELSQFGSEIRINCEYVFLFPSFIIDNCITNFNLNLGYPCFTILTVVRPMHEYL
jgi:hypothetical protein